MFSHFSRWRNFIKIFTLVIFSLLLLANFTTAQQINVEDSLRAVINQQKGNTSQVNALAHLGNELNQFDSAIKYGQQGLSLAKKINYKNKFCQSFYNLNVLINLFFRFILSIF